jgi:hypothetical protein
MAWIHIHDRNVDPLQTIAISISTVELDYHGNVRVGGVAVQENCNVWNEMGGTETGACQLSHCNQTVCGSW